MKMDANSRLIGKLSPEADSITSLIRLLNPAEQKTLIRLLNAYLEQEQASVPKSKGTSESISCGAQRVFCPN